MTSEIYEPLSSWPRGISIKALFEQLLAIGMTPFAIRATITDTLEAVDVIVEPPLPKVWALKITQVGKSFGLVILAGDGTSLDPGQIFIQSRTILHPAPFPIGQTVVIKNVPIAPAPDKAAKEPAVETPEEQAIVWLAAKLKADVEAEKVTKFDDYKDECMKQFRIKPSQYRHHVWGEARVRAGLPRQSPPGPKPTKKNRKNQPG